MPRKVIAALAAAAMALTSLSAPAAAHDRNRNLDRFIAGAGALLLLHEFNKGRTSLHFRKHYGNRRMAVLPRYCLTRVETRRGPVRMLGQRCLNRNYRQAHRLPQACKIHVKTWRHGRRVTRVGYQPRCLRQRGYRIG